MEGWIKSYRKFMKWEWYKTPNMFHLFHHLLFNANRSDGSWQGVFIKRGQLVTGLKSLTEDTGISVQSLRTCLSKLKSTGEITIKSTNKYSIITICNYDNYQPIDDLANNQTNNQPNKRLTNNQQTTNNKQEYKEEEEREEVKISLADFEKTEERDKTFIENLMSGKLE